MALNNMFSGWFKSIIKSMYDNLFALEIEQQQNELSNLKTELEKAKIRKQLDYPIVKGNISLQEVRTLLSPICEQVFVSDENFSLTSQDEASKFSEETHVRYAQYIVENHDCENFSWALLGYWSEGLKSFPFGFAWSQNHSFNIMIDDQKNIWIIEPQTNKWMTLEESKKNNLYGPIRLIVM